jgi:hypothetical protein
LQLLESVPSSLLIYSSLGFVQLNGAPLNGRDSNVEIAYTMKSLVGAAMSVALLKQVYQFPGRKLTPTSRSFIRLLVKWAVIFEFFDDAWND